MKQLITENEELKSKLQQMQILLEEKTKIIEDLKTKLQESQYIALGRIPKAFPLTFVAQLKIINCKFGYSDKKLLDLIQERNKERLQCKKDLEEYISTTIVPSLEDIKKLSAEKIPESKQKRLKKCFDYVSQLLTSHNLWLEQLTLGIANQQKVE